MGIIENIFKGERDRLEVQIESLSAERVALSGQIGEFKAQREALGKNARLENEAKRLKEEVENLRVTADRMKEDNEREKREVLHMVGLERKRQEQEAIRAKADVEAAKRDAILGVREENLKAERAAFEGQMKFQKAEFDKQVNYLQDLMGQIIERLPTMNIERKDSNVTKTTKTA